MGRVRRYKKFKSCDPFAKQGPKVVDTIHDEPIDIFEEQERRAEKRIRKREEDPEHIERMLQREAIRQLRMENEKNGGSGLKKNKHELEGRKENETMKQFKTRIREETRAALRNEVKKITATAKKKREYLTDKKFKKKGISRFDPKEELIEEGFSSRHDGLLRESDRGGADTFDAPEIVVFGERMDRPPEFAGVAPLRLKSGNSYVEKPVPSNKKHHAIEEKAQRSLSWATATGAIQEKEEEEEEERPRKKAKRSKTSISDIVGGEDMDDDGNRSRYLGNMHFSSAGKTKAKQKTTLKPGELERLREQAQAAYKALRDKKRTF